MDEIDTVLSNPYRTLGVSASASAREIRRRADELKVQLDLGVAPPGLTAERLDRARRTLDDPADRLTHRFLWLLTTGGEVPPSFDRPSLDQVRLALEPLRAAADQGPGPDASLARHDAAVVAWHASLAQLEHVASFEFGLADWAALAQDDAFWRAFGLVGGESGDPRVEAALARLRSEYPSLVLEPVVAAAQDPRVRDAVLAAIVSSIRQSGFSPTVVREAVREATRRVRSDAQKALKRFSDAVYQIPSADGGAFSVEPRHAVGFAQGAWRNDARPVLQRLEEFGPEATDAGIQDDAARILLKLAAAMFAAARDGPAAIATLDEAVQTAASGSTKAELRGHQTTLRKNHHLREMHLGVEGKDLAGVLAHLELAAEHADGEELEDLLEQGRQLRAMAHGAIGPDVARRKREIELDLSNPLAGGRRVRSLAKTDSDPALAHSGTSQPRASGRPAVPSSGSKGKRWLAAAAAVLLLVFGANLLLGSSTSTPTSRSAATRGPQPTATPSCTQRLAALERGLKADDPEIEDLQDRMAAMEAELEEFQTGIDVIERIYPGMVLPPDVYRRYNNLVDQYNAMAAQYRSLDAKENRQVADYNRRVDEYNTLQRSC